MEPIRVVHQERIPWRAYVMVVLCLVAGPWIFYEWNRQWTRVPPGVDGWAPNAALAAQTESLMQSEVAGTPIADVLVVLYANNRPGLAGKRVSLERVCVRAVSGQGAFWASQAGTQPVFVAMKTPNARVEPNQAVNVDGTIQLVRGRDEARSKFPGLSAQQLDQLAATGAYVEADAVEVTGWY